LFCLLFLGSKKRRVDTVAIEEAVMWTDLKNINNDLQARQWIVLTNANRICKPSRSKLVFIRQCFVDLADIFIRKIGSNCEIKLSLTGTPGIGKSSFIVYFMYRLLKKRPEEITHVLFHRADNELVLFNLVDNNSPPVMIDNKNPHGGQWPKKWLIVSDASDCLSGITASPMLWISSPRPKAFRDYEQKQCDTVNCHCMPVWEREEIIDLVMTNDLTNNVDENNAALIKFDFFGGVPRTLFKISEEKENDFRGQIISKIHAAAKDVFAAVSVNSDSHEVSHQLVHMVPEGKGYGRGNVQNLIIASNKILEILSETSYEETLAFLSETCVSIHGSKPTVFEQYVMLRFLHGGVGGDLRSLSAEKKVNFGPSKEPKTSIHFVHGGENESTENDMLGIISNLITSYSSSSSSSSLQSSPQAVSTPVLLVPRKSGQKIFDFAIFDVGSLDLYQVTIAPSHEIHGVNELKKIVNFCARNKITLRMIVVVPSLEIFRNFKAQPIIAGKSEAKTAPSLDQFVLCVPLKNSPLPLGAAEELS